MQNELIAAMSSEVIEGINKEIGNSRHTIKVDSTKGPTGVENIFIIICFFNEHSLIVTGRLLLLSSTDSGDAEWRSSTSIAGTRKQKDSLSALPEPPIASCSGTCNVG